MTSAGVSPGKAAVMQICGDINHCYVMHIIHSGIPQYLQSLLEDPTYVKVRQIYYTAAQVCTQYVIYLFIFGLNISFSVLIYCLTYAQVGVGIGSDATKVSKDHNVSIQALEDLSSLANQKLGGDLKNWSLQSLTEMLICKQVNTLTVFVNNFSLHLIYLIFIFISALGHLDALIRK